MERTINICPGIGASAHIIQHTELLFPSVYFEQPHLYLVQQGHKRIRWQQREIVAHAGELLIIDGGQTVDIINGPSNDGVFSCQLLTCDPQLFTAQPGAVETTSSTPFDAVLALRNLPCALMHSFETTSLALALKHRFPTAIIRHKMLEILLWLKQFNINFIHNEARNLTQRVRRCLATDPHNIWTAAEVAETLSMSEVMLRRKLSAENTSLRNLMIDVRMSSALALLQSTDWPISVIAQHVGYESSSRFAERFRKRFGFAPTAVRGHQRAMEPSAIRPDHFSMMQEQE
ncbi:MULTISPECIES: helix-turn-helix transcriptional regulator [Serratia]|jgi:AraC-like DNA-binding protein|uniref:AraC family transcriptional regulator n=1 Tax=Serratia grimesii TaxID=82995 RepID=A0ABR4UAL9_9GAMM|nr:helix-turn-helix domain-containing protein [Serratia grimesii]KFB89075.1 AraC family transcriptional regulator [Serratia grimesii]CAI0869961.1 Urease operon transcriptional activator [Serratia grimesii]CAI0902777.1 Urease operon transcriptional activator [Serratia grimesii]CAI2414846.1 Urease operon transcriptional activator [Serratia grimesii]CUW21874.1 Urease operon transcriptional activator [Serratia grimesii]